LGGEELVALISAVPFAFMAYTQTVTNLPFYTVQKRWTYWTGESEWTHIGAERES
jgi:hypothetical protein